jgi:hypothetical protein
VPFCGQLAEWLKLFALLAYAPWFHAVTDKVLFTMNVLVQWFEASLVSKFSLKIIIHQVN